jgi:diamine N-acetyltransferase
VETSAEQSRQPIINIAGEKVALGPFERWHLPLYNAWRNNLETRRTMGSTPRPETLEQQVAWFEDAQGSDDGALFVIYDRASLAPVGACSLAPINMRHRTAQFDIMIGEPEFRGRGYGTEATRLVLEYAFATLGVQNVMLMVAAVNEAGIRAYRRAGFREFGRRRRAWFVDGQYYDTVYMDCLAEDLREQLVDKT